MNARSQGSSPEKSPAWRLEAAIDQGARDYQEDAFDTWVNADSTGILVVVADGAGGHGGGAEASAIAVAEAGRRVAEADKTAEAGPFLEGWMLGAHEAVRKTVAGGGKGGPRAAVVAMRTKGPRVDWVHAGDCRLYHFRGGERLARTRDDSVVQILFEQGQITESEMGRHEDQNRLLQAIGGEDPPKPRRGSAEALPGDVFVLCSDGFWENLEPEELARLTEVPARRRRKELRRAMRLAVSRGGGKADNATAVIAVYGELVGKEGGRGRALRACLLLWLLGLVAVLAAVVLGLSLLGSAIRSQVRPWIEALRRSPAAETTGATSPPQAAEATPPDSSPPPEDARPAPPRKQQ